MCMAGCTKILVFEVAVAGVIFEPDTVALTEPEARACWLD